MSNDDLHKELERWVLSTKGNTGDLVARLHEAPLETSPLQPPVSFSDPCVADYSQVDMQGSRYKSVNFGACENPWDIDPLLSLETALKLAGYESRTTEAN